eukprot:2742114-Rhodomonas_salina.2
MHTQCSVLSAQCSVLSAQRSALSAHAYCENEGAVLMFADQQKRSVHVYVRAQSSCTPRERERELVGMRVGEGEGGQD